VSGVGGAAATGAKDLGKSRFGKSAEKGGSGALSRSGGWGEVVMDAKLFSDVYGRKKLSCSRQDHLKGSKKKNRASSWKNVFNTLKNP